MEAVWNTLIVAVVVSLLSPAVMLWLKSWIERQTRRDAEEREDEKERATKEYREKMQAGLELVRHQTDGVMTQVAALAKATGHVEGGREAELKAQDTASTLALGQQQGRKAERESAAVKAIESGDKMSPIAVADDRTATATERTAAASERVAGAAERTADAAKKE